MVPENVPVNQMVIFLLDQFVADSFNHIFVVAWELHQLILLDFVHLTLKLSLEHVSLSQFDVNIFQRLQLLINYACDVIRAVKINLGDLVLKLLNFVLKRRLRNWFFSCG